MDWSSPQVIWFFIGLVLILMEFGIPGLITVFFGIGAWIVALLCLLFDLPLNLQLIIFIICSVLPLILLRNWFKTLIGGRTMDSPVNIEELEEFLGRTATVVEEISPKKKGRVEFRGSTWNAEAYEKITVGKTVEIIDKNNITLVVKSI